MKPDKEMRADMEEQELEPCDVFVDLGMLIVEGRMPGITERGYGEGPHCPPIHGQNKHKCDPQDPQCNREEQFRKHMLLLWRNSIPMSIEVLLCPDCCHHNTKPQTVETSVPEPSYILLEQWTIQMLPKRVPDSHITGKNLLHAVRSYLHFSQLSAWYSLSAGKSPHNVTYRICVPGEAFSNKFSKSPDAHAFPVANIGRNSAMKIIVKAMPRCEAFPPLLCKIHEKIEQEISKDNESNKMSVACAIAPLPEEKTGLNLKDSLRKINKLSNKESQKLQRESPVDTLLGDSLLDPPQSLQMYPKRYQSPSRSGSPVMEAPEHLMFGSSNAAKETRCHLGYEGKSERSRQRRPLSDRNLPKPRAVEKKVGDSLLPVKEQFPSTSSVFHETKPPSHPTSSGSSFFALTPKETEEILNVLRQRTVFRPSANTKKRDLPKVGHYEVKDHQNDLYNILNRNNVKDYSMDFQNNKTVVWHQSGSNDQPKNWGSKPHPKDTSKPFNLNYESSQKQLSKNKPLDSNSNTLEKDLFNRTSEPLPISDLPSQSLSQDKKQYVPTTEQICTNLTPIVLPNSCKEYLVEHNRNISCDIKNKNLNNITSDSVPPRLSSKFDDDVSTSQKKSELVRPNNWSKVLLQGSYNNGSLKAKENAKRDEMIASQKNFSKSTGLLKHLLRKEPVSPLEIDYLSDCKNGQANKLVPTATDKANFRRSLDSATCMVFHSKTGLPLTSSPAPLRKGTCFDFDCTLTSVTAIKNALFDKDSDQEDEIANKVLSDSAPATTTNNSLLGNFEESVLNGRLEPVSTVEGFTAEIGASGSFCPRHITMPVTVFFYTLSDADKVSTPYLGHINLGMKGYHIPKKGTVQVTLFNPHGTVVKMFVVMYDCSDMPPNCQTFLRQRTLYMPVGASDEDPEARKWLRYLIHLRFFSSKSGRIYLHTDIRLVIFRKSDMDAATIMGTYELRSFTRGPTNPCYSPKR